MRSPPEHLQATTSTSPPPPPSPSTYLEDIKDTGQRMYPITFSFSLAHVFCQSSLEGRENIRVAGTSQALTSVNQDFSLAQLVLASH